MPPTKTWSPGSVVHRRRVCAQLRGRAHTAAPRSCSVRRVDELVTDPPAGELVRAHRDRLRLSQAQLAARVGTTQAANSRVERGRGSLRLGFLSAILRAMDLQLTIGTAPLWEKVDAEIAAASGRSVDEIFEEAKLDLYFGGFDLLRIEESLGEIEHCYCGLTAAALLGAPVRVQDCELMFPDDAATLDQFDLWL